MAVNTSTPNNQYTIKAERFVARAIRKKSLFRFFVGIILLLLFVGMFVVCGFFLIAVKFNIFALLLLLFSIVISIGIASSLKRHAKTIFSPLEAKTIKGLIRDGYTYDDIYTAVMSPQKKVLNICIGNGLVVDRENVINSFLLKNVTVLYLIEHKTNGITDKYAIAVVDASGEKIEAWVSATYPREETKRDMLMEMHEISQYFPNARIGFN